MLNIALSILRRLKEPSTWAGVAAIASAVGVPAVTLDIGYNAIALVGGIAAVLIPEVGVSSSRDDDNG